MIVGNAYMGVTRERRKPDIHAIVFCAEQSNQVLDDSVWIYLHVSQAGRKCYLADIHWTGADSQKWR